MTHTRLPCQALPTVMKMADELHKSEMHDPTSEEWHEVLASEYPPWILEAAKAERRGKRSGVTQR